VDRVGGLMVENKDVLIATTGGDREFASLIGIGLENGLIGKEHATEVMWLGQGRVGGIIVIIVIRGGSNVVVIKVGRDGRGSRAFGGAEVLGFLILVAKSSGNAGRKMF
jgi:hypothetical protein